MRTPGRSGCFGALTCFAVIVIAPRAKADGSTAAPPGSPAEVQQTSGLLFPIDSVIQAYEPNEIGYTFDVGKESFMDFTVSMMLPLWIGETYPPQFRTEPAGFWRPLRYARRLPYVYFAVTQRAGQYLETRYSSPVVCSLSSQKDYSAPAASAMRKAGTKVRASGAASPARRAKFTNSSRRKAASTEIAPSYTVTGCQPNNQRVCEMK